MFEWIRGGRELLVFIKVLLFVSIPMYAFFRMFLNYVNEKSVKIKAIDVYASMIIYCLFMLGFFLNKAAAGAGERLHIFEMTGIKDNGYASLANEYVVSVIVLLTLGMISFWIVSLTYGDLPPQTLSILS